MEKGKQTPRPFDADDERELFDEQFSVASATECTGLIPTPPVTEPEVNSYSEIYDIPLADDREAANNGLKKARKQ